MKETTRIADQLRRSVEGPAWHGPALLELLRGVTPQQAVAKPIRGWKSIWELVLHAIVWQTIVRQHLRGTFPRIKLGGPRDWPPAPSRPTAAAWSAAIAKLKRSSRAIEKAAREYPVAKLDRPLRKGYTSAYTQLLGVVQHNVWHGGQIAAVKRAQRLPALAPKS